MFLLTLLTIQLSFSCYVLYSWPENIDNLLLSCMVGAGASFTTIMMMSIEHLRRDRPRPSRSHSPLERLILQYIEDPFSINELELDLINSQPALIMIDEGVMDVTLGTEILRQPIDYVIDDLDNLVRVDDSLTLFCPRCCDHLPLRNVSNTIKVGSSFYPATPHVIHENTRTVVVRDDDEGINASIYPPNIIVNDDNATYMAPRYDGVHILDDLRQLSGTFNEDVSNMITCK